MGAKVTRHRPASHSDPNKLPEDYELLCKSIIDNEFLQITNMLLDQGCTININKKTNSPLHLAALYERKEIVEKLLKHKADVHAINETGKIPLHIACSRGNIEIVKLLLDHASDINARDENDEAPIHAVVIPVIPEFVEYPGLENIIEAVVKILVNHGADVNIKEKNGYTPLHFSAKNGYEEVVRYLISVNADPNSLDKNHITPLHLAAMCGHKDIMKILLHVGADVDAMDVQGKTPLHYAASAGFADSVELLMEYHCNINAVDSNNMRPVFCAIENNYAEVVELLLKAGAGLRNVSKSLYLAVYNDYREIVRLIVDNGADVDERCPNGSTLLHHIIHNNWGYDFVNFLVENGANINAVDETGLNALTHAIINPQPDIVKYLIDKGIDINCRISYGYTLLHLAVICRHTKFGCTEEQKQLLTVLFESGADINAECEAEKTPLYYAGNCVKEFLLSYIAKNMAKNNDISDKNMMLIRNNPELNDIYKQFELELTALKKLRISKNVSFFDLFTKTNIQKIASMTINESIMRIIESDDYKKKFPKFGEDVRKIILKKKKKSCVTALARKALAKCWNSFHGSTINPVKTLIGPSVIRKTET